MASRKSWLLMNSEEISQVILSNNALFRKQKSYYKSRNNVIMMARIQEAENTLKGTTKTLESESTCGLQPV